MKTALTHGTPTDEARTGENCFLLSGFPRAPEFDGDVSCLIALTYNEKILRAKTSLVRDVKKIIPACWGGQFSPHFVKAEYAFVETYGWTHLALIEAPDYGVTFKANIYFGRDKIENPFILLGFNEHDKSYHHFHCVDCCHGIGEFFIENQPIWKVLHAEAGSHVKQTNFTRH